MSEQQVRVTFQPRGRSVDVLAGTKVLEAAARAGMTVDTPCGGEGTCGKCRVQVVSGSCPPSSADMVIFSDAKLREGWRLACQTAIRGETVIHVPASSLFADQHRIITESHTATAEEILPAVRKVFVELPLPTLEAGEADLFRLEKQLGLIKADLPLLRHLPGLLRKNGFRGTAVLTDHRLIDFESSDTTARCHGVAVDLGTTTLAASLLDLNSGEELAVTSAMNPQVRFGDDVLSRIKLSADPAGSRELTEVIVEAINELIVRLCCEIGVERSNIYEVTFAGNTTMQHLLCGLDVQPLGQVPFVPTIARGMMLSAAELGIVIHPRGGAYFFPVIGGFVGGDTVAGMLSTRISRQEGAVLMVDIGTNGEIVLASDGKLWAASTAAGPAFEGARISCGMRATSGAIEKVVLDGDLHCGVIGGSEPMGLCGSGLIDLAAELLRLGIINPVGRLLPPDELPANLQPAIRARVRQDTAGAAVFVLSDKSNQGRREPLSLTQRDVRELQLATGAIRAGIAILLKQAGMTGENLQRVLIAGGFGSFIRRSNAQRLGLLPAHIDHQRIQYVGNASLAGAKWALLSTAARKEGEDLARRTAHVELSQDGDFQMQFVDAMIFPDVSWANPSE